MDIEQLKAAVTCETVYFNSNGHRAKIHALIWAPRVGVPVRGVVQLAHGMVEHIERYDDFARFLGAAGFAVAANDHIGHGGSVLSADRLGCLPTDGAGIMVDDVHSLRLLVQDRFPGVPYVLFGHSMGSFIARAYLGTYGEGLAGAIICGTGQQPLAVSRLGGWLARRIASSKGWDYRSTMLHNMGVGAYAKAVPDAKTELDWLNTDPDRVQDYIDDPLCGAMFSAGGYASLLKLTELAASGKTVAAVPQGLPVLFVAGAQDPVGDMGKAVRQAADQLGARANVQCKVYEGMRHEILNEPAHELVYADILQWLGEVVPAGAPEDAPGAEAEAAPGAAPAPEAGPAPASGGAADAAGASAPDQEA